MVIREPKIGLDSDLAKLVVLMFASSSLFGVTWSILAPYLRSLGFTAAEYGGLGALGLYFSLAATLVSGWLSDRVGSRILILAGTLASSLSLVMLSTGHTYLIYASFCLSGLGMGAVHVAGIVLASRIVSESLVHSMSYTAASSMIGGGLGTLVGGWIPVILGRLAGLSMVESYRIVLLIAGILSPLPALLILPRVREVVRTGESETKKRDIEVRMPWGVLVRLLIINMIISLGAGMSIHIIDYYFVAKFNVTSRELGTVLGAQNTIMGATMLFMPTLSSRVGGPLRAYILVAAPSIPLIVAMTLTSSYTIAAALYIVRSILMNVANPLYQAFEMSLIPSEYRGRGASLISVAWQIPAGIGRYVGGHMMDRHIESPLLATSALYTLALTLLAILFSDHVFTRKTPRS